MRGAEVPTAFVRLWNGEGTVDLRVPITQVGGTVRVAVGEPGRRSEVWRIWANQSHGDIYIASRSLAGIQKYWLHESGDWRYAFTSEYFASQEDEAAERPASSRLLDQWRHNPGADGRVVLSIRVRAEDVARMDDGNLKGDIFWIPTPEPGHAVFIGLLMMRSDLELALLGSKPIDLLLLPNGDAALVVWKAFPLTDAVLEGLERSREEANALVSPEVRARRGGTRLTPWRIWVRRRERRAVRLGHGLRVEIGAGGPISGSAAPGGRCKAASVRSQDPAPRASRNDLNAEDAVTLVPSMLRRLSEHR